MVNRRETIPLSLKLTDNNNSSTITLRIGFQSKTTENNKFHSKFLKQHPRSLPTY